MNKIYKWLLLLSSLFLYLVYSILIVICIFIISLGWFPIKLVIISFLILGISVLIFYYYIKYKKKLK